MAPTVGVLARVQIVAFQVGRIKALIERNLPTMGDARPFPCLVLTEIVHRAADDRQLEQQRCASGCVATSMRYDVQDNLKA